MHVMPCNYDLWSGAQGYGSIRIRSRVGMGTTYMTATVNEALEVTLFSGRSISSTAGSIFFVYIQLRPS